MSEISIPEFIHPPTFAEYCANLGYGQRLALLAFLDMYCERPYDITAEPPDGRDAHFPFPVGHVRSINNTIYAVNSIHSAHEDPADYLAVVAEERDGVFHVNELEIVQVQHVPHGRFEGLDKIINAKWHETSKKVSLRLGHAASITTQDQTGIITQSPGLSLG